MKVRYIGPSGSGVEVIHPDPDAPDANTTTACLPGEPVDLPDEQAASLVQAGTFEAVAHQRRRSTTDSTEEGD